jgi:RsmE family RNA methyltransferase
LFVGPEGGLMAEELFLAEKNGFYVMNLGLTTLRGETAAIVASFVVNNI